MAAAYTAASISSAIMPQPPGNDSIFRIPRGLNMSKRRKRASEMRMSHQGASCRPPQSGKREMSWPTVSSTHAATGSFPQYFSETPLAHVPAIAKKSMRTRVAIQARRPGHHKYKGSHKMIPTSAPQVPGATGKNPAPNEVAIILGKRGNFSSVMGTGRLDFIIYIRLDEEAAFLTLAKTDLAMPRAASFLIGAKLSQSSKLTSWNSPCLSRTMSHPKISTLSTSAAFMHMLLTFSYISSGKSPSPSLRNGTKA